MRFSGKRVLVTGGSGEIGARVAGAMRAEGAEVTILDRAPPAEAGLGFFACDLSTADGLEAVACWAAARDWDILVNVAGILHFGPFEAQEPDHLLRTFMVNLVAPTRLAQAVLPGMRSRGWGQIVNIGSVFGAINFAHFATYSASKAGLRGLSQALRRELAGSGVRVTYVAPRAVRTGFNNAQVMAFAKLTKTAMDEPGLVAARIVKAIAERRREIFIGFPEALYVRINAIAPSLIDRALAPADRQVAKLFT